MNKTTLKENIMQINLRKAAALQSDIQSTIRSIRIDTRASFEERETVADDVSEAISAVSYTHLRAHET